MKSLLPKDTLLRTYFSTIRDYPLGTNSFYENVLLVTISACMSSLPSICVTISAFWLATLLLDTLDSIQAKTHMHIQRSGHLSLFNELIAKCSKNKKPTQKTHTKAFQVFVLEQFIAQFILYMTPTVWPGSYIKSISRIF